VNFIYNPAVISGLK